MTTTINGSSPSVTFSDGTTQSTAGLPLTGGTINSAASTAPLIASINGTEAMRVDGSGNVGIGTSSPTYKLNVYAGTGSAACGVGSSNSGGFVYFDVYNSSATVSGSASIMRLITENAAGTGTTSTDFYRYATGGCYLFNNETSSNAFLAFGVGSSERMRIDSSGNLLVGNTSTPTGKSGITLTNGYNCKAGYSGSVGANIYNIMWTGSPQLWIDTTNIGTIAFTSDYRIKQNVATQTATALDRISQVRSVTYELANYGNLFKADGVSREGFIAHELQAIIPSAVDGVKDDPNQIQSLKLDALCSVMVKAIQELNATVTAQAATIATLQAQVTALNTKVGI